MSGGEVSGDMIAEALAPLDAHITMLEGSKAKTDAYAKELSEKIALIQSSVELLATLKQKVEGMKKAAVDGLQKIRDAETKGAADAVNAAKKAKSQCEADAKEKIDAVVGKIKDQKENITAALNALEQQGFKQPMDQILGAVKALEAAFGGEGGSGPGNVAAKTKEIEDRERRLKQDAVDAFRMGRQGGGRRTRRRGGFRYGVPKSALPRTLRSVLSLKTKSSRRKSPKRRKGKKSRKRKRRRRR